MMTAEHPDINNFFRYRISIAAAQDYAVIGSSTRVEGVSEWCIVSLFRKGKRVF
jgi:hypothetical protein